MIDWSTPDTVAASLEPDPVDHEAVIVGTGFGGMAQAIQLDRLGIHDVVLLERSDDLGGTWHANRYPGVAVDIASPTYSFSFEPNPDWTRLYAPGHELKAYADHVADRYGLRERMRFDHSVTGARWDHDAQRWTVDVQDRPSITCRYLVVATGVLSQVKVPDIPGLDSFDGTVLHTARWDASHDLAGERVAMIGTGATAVQLLPEIAGDAAHVSVFQRTPIWVTPKPDLPVPKAARALFRRVPVTQKALRAANGVFIETVGMALAFNTQMPFLVRGLEALSKAHLRAQVRDPATRAALTPGYDFWCKRPTFSNDYYPSFNRTDVALVTAPIDHVAPSGIVTEDGVSHDVDTIILATGFSVQSGGSYPPFPIYGRDGREMGATFREEGFESYEGITVAGFPNLFYTSGPFSFTGLSFFYVAESQMAHVARLLTELRKRHAVAFEVKPAAQRRFVARADRQAKSTVWANGDCGSANSYYFNEHGDTRLGRLDPTPVAMWRDRHFDLDDYRYEQISDPILRGLGPRPSEEQDVVA